MTKVYDFQKLYFYQSSGKKTYISNCQTDTYILKNQPIENQSYIFLNLLYV